MKVTFTDYALMRMHQRDILEEEVVAVLDSPPARHTARRDGRREARGRVRRKRLLVVYVRRDDGNEVLNAMWED
jgi:hypothetical protein